MRLVKIACLLFLLAAGTVEAWEADSSDGTDWTISSIASSVLVDEGLLKKLLMEAEQDGGSLNVTPVYYDEKTKEYTKVNYSCYQRMREAMRMMRLTVDAAYRGSIVTATPQPSPTPKEIWDATMKECVQ